MSGLQKVCSSKAALAGRAGQAKRSGRLPRRLALLCALSLLALAPACSRNQATEPQQAQGGRGAGGRGGPGGPNAAGGPPVRVQTVQVQHMTVPRQVDLVGTLVSPDQARVSSEVAGVVRQVRVQLGHDVRVGAPLVELDTRELELAVERAESALRQTEAQLGMGGSAASDSASGEQVAAVRTALATRDDARTQLARIERLVSQGVLPRAELDNVQTRVKVAEAAYQNALDNAASLKASLQDRKAALELAKKKVADATIRSPISGSVSEQLVQVGEFIRENTPVVTIVQMQPLKLRTSVQERHADVVRIGMPVQFQVESFPDVPFQGRVAYLSPAVDQATRTLALEVMVDNSRRLLKPGFFAKGVITLKQDADVVGVSENAVLTLAGVSNVFVLHDNKVKLQNVTLGVHQNGMFEILTGLQGNETLASSNLSQLADGAHVTVVTAGGAAPAAASNGRGAPAAGGEGRRGEQDRRGERGSRPSGEELP